MEEWEIQGMIQDLRTEFEDKIEDLRREIEDLREMID